MPSRRRVSSATRGRRRHSRRVLRGGGRKSLRVARTKSCGGTYSFDKGTFYKESDFVDHTEHVFNPETVTFLERHYNRYKRLFLSDFAKFIPERTKYDRVDHCESTNQIVTFSIGNGDLLIPKNMKDERYCTGLAIPKNISPSSKFTVDFGSDTLAVGIEYTGTGQSSKKVTVLSVHSSRVKGDKGHHIFHNQKFYEEFEKMAGEGDVIIFGDFNFPWGEMKPLLDEQYQASKTVPYRNTYMQIPKQWHPYFKHPETEYGFQLMLTNVTDMNVHKLPRKPHISVNKSLIDSTYIINNTFDKHHPIRSNIATYGSDHMALEATRPTDETKYIAHNFWESGAIVKYKLKDLEKGEGKLLQTRLEIGKDIVTQGLQNGSVLCLTEIGFLHSNDAIELWKLGKPTVDVDAKTSKFYRDAVKDCKEDADDLSKLNEYQQYLTRLKGKRKGCSYHTNQKPKEVILQNLIFPAPFEDFHLGNNAWIFEHREQQNLLSFNDWLKNPE